MYPRFETAFDFLVDLAVVRFRFAVLSSNAFLDVRLEITPKRPTRTVRKLERAGLPVALTETRPSDARSAYRRM